MSTEKELFLHRLDFALDRDNQGGFPLNPPF
jgi:hypothetical protein